MITMDRLSELANKVGTDKGTAAFCSHSYTVIYNQLFEPLLENNVKMLEIGVADPRFPGASAQMWRDYFPQLYFVGYDINPEAKKFENVADYMYMFIGDQNNPDDLNKCIAEHGGEFDIILDDGSHYSEHILTSFEHLFPHLKPGGYYIVEDLHSVYTKADVTIPKIKDIIENKAFNVEYIPTNNGKLLVMRRVS